MGIQVGKLGPAVGVMWKGRNVYRSYNPFVKNPRTPEQIVQRRKFSLLAQFNRVFSPASNFGFAYKAKTEKTMQRAIFMKVNKDIVTISGETSQVNFDAIQVSEGPITNVVFGTPTIVTNPGGGKSIEVPITQDMRNIGLATDKDIVRVYAFFTVNGIMTSEVGERLNSDGKINVPIPEGIDDQEVHLYGFTSANVNEPTFVEGYNGNMYPEMASPTAYIGQVTLS